MKTYKFYERSEVVEFLKGYDFKYYVPEIEDGQFYEIHVTDNDKIDTCYVIKLSGGCIYHMNIFYKYNHAYDFDKAEIGEKRNRLSNLLSKLDAVGLNEDENKELDSLIEELEVI